MLATESWPQWDPDLVRQDSVTMVIQVNGRVRDRIEVAADIDEVEAEMIALASARIAPYLEGATIRRVVVRVPTLVNVVLS